MWYDNDYRRVFMDMHINDTNPEYLSKLDVKDFVKTMKDAEVTSVVVKAKSHVGLHYWPSKYGKMHETLKNRNLDYVGEMIKECHKNNINVILYFSQVYDNYAYANHKSWRIRHFTGVASRTKLPGANTRYGLVCPNNPEYREYCHNILSELAQTYDFESIFLDMPFWPRECFCKHCQERFLKETGKVLPAIHNPNSKIWIEYLHRRQAWIDEFMRSNTKAIKDVNPNITIEHNMAAIGLDWMQGNTEANFSASDYASGDYYGGYLEQTFMCKYYNNMTENKPFCYITSKCDNTLFYHTVSRSNEDLLIHNLNALVHGGAFAICDAINPDGTITNSVYQNNIKKVFETTKSVEKYVSGNIKSDVAIWYNTALKTNKNYIQSPLNIAKILREKNIAFDVVGSKNLKDLTAKVLVMNSVQEISDYEIEQLRSYLKNGGSIFFTGKLANNKKLESLVGVDIKGTSKYNYCYLNPAEEYKHLFKHFDKSSPYPIENSAFEARIINKTKTKTLATLSYPYTLPNSLDFSAIHSNPPGIHTTLPAVTQTEYGNGKIIWIASTPELTLAHDCRQCLADIIKYLMGDKTPEFVSNAPDFVELLKWEKDGKTYVSLVNQQTVTPVYPICDIEFTIPGEFDSIRLVSDDSYHFDTEIKDGKTTIKVGKTDVFHIFEFSNE